MAFSSLVSVISYLNNYISSIKEDTEKAKDRVLHEPGLSAKGGLVSITDTIQPLLVDPRVVISTDLRGVDHVDNVLYILIDTFAMYYLQAFTMLGDIESYKTIKTLKELSSIKRGDYTKIGPVVLEDMEVALEDIKYLSEEVNTEKKDTKNETAQGAINAGKEFSGLKLVKIVEVTVSAKEKTRIKIPVTIRLNPAYVANDVLDGIIGTAKARHSLMNRLDDLRSGNISFFRDFLFNQDIRKEHQKLLMKDKTGLYSEVSSKVNSAIGRYARTGEKGYGAFYNMAIISEADADRAARALGGQLTKKRTRDKLFNRNYLTILVVMDREWERATFYTRDMDGYATLGFDMLESKKDSSDKNALELLKSFSNNNGVVF